MSTEDSKPLKQGERNPGASIQARLKNYAKAQQEDMQFVLARYIIERFLYRLSISPHAGRFVLRGATLFSLWSVEGETLYRPTRDLDMLAMGDSSAEAFKTCLTEVLSVDVPEDGVVFAPETLRIEERTVGRAYPGLYVEALATLGSARPRLEMDLSFGEAISPAPEDADLPTLLDQPRPRLKVYPRETVVAEKTQALVELGLGNTRLKDFFDLWYLSRCFDFDGSALQGALRSTFTRRGTPFPLGSVPDALTDEFALDPIKQHQWNTFRSRTSGSSAPESLADLIAELTLFLSPLLISPLEGFHWPSGGPWSESEFRNGPPVTEPVEES